MRDASSPRPDDNPEISIVICTLNEHEAIAGVLAEIDAALPGCAREIIVVDDSTDMRTGDRVLAYAQAHPGVRLVKRWNERGLGTAAARGWEAARGRLLALMDGDGQHDPALLARMLQAQREGGCDVVVASRYLQSAESGLGRVRHLGSRVAVLATRWLLGIRIADPMSGCFLMTRAWFEQVRPRLKTPGFKILIDVLAGGAQAPRLAQVPACLRERHGGRSKLDLKVVLDLGAQLVEKASRGLVSARMAMFFAVGMSGLVAHVATLALATRGLGWPLWLGQMLAIWLAMTCNFLLNNLLTFRDRRLHGLDALQGLAMFYAACLSGAIISEAVALALAGAGVGPLAAGAGGAILAGVWNYHLARRTTWRDRQAPAGAAGTVAVPPRPPRND